MSENTCADSRDKATADRSQWVRWLFPYVELAMALLAGGLWYLQGGAVWYAGARPGPWPLVLLGGVWVVRAFVLRLPLRPSAFDFGLWAFVATAALGVWAAYDHGPAWAKFWLIIGAVGIYYAVAHQPDRQHLTVALALFSGFGAVLALYFVATNDWSAMEVKVPALVSLGSRLSSLLPALPGHRMHPNVVAGILATMMPLGVALTTLRPHDRRSGFRRPVRLLIKVYGVVTVAVTGLGLLLTMSRGAWLATVAAAALWATWHGVGWGARRRSGDTGRTWTARLAISGGILVVALALAAIAASLVLTGRLPGMELLSRRLKLFRDSLLLAGDYVFTGAGLGMFPMQYSVYTLLIHAIVLPHSHNMLLNLLIEQGVLGPAAYVVMAGACLVLALRRLPSAGRGRAVIIEAGLVSLAVALAHGQFNDSLYSSRGALFLLLPFGIVMAVAGTHTQDQEPVTTGNPSRWRRWGLVSALTVVLAGSIIAGLRPARAAWYANAGALAQAKTQLAAYDNDRSVGLSMDQLRQREDLIRAQALFGRAISIQPGNRTARQRLAAIALARAEYADALTHTSAAWDAGHRDAVTRMLHSDALVAAGRTEIAAEAVRGLEWAEPRLLGQAWYRYWSGEDYRRAADAWETVLLLDPNNEEAAESLARAREKLAE